MTKKKSKKTPKLFLWGHFGLLLKNSPFYEYITFYLYVHVLTWYLRFFFFFFLFTFWLLWIALLRTFRCTFSYRHVFISCGHIPRNGLPFFFFNKRLHCYTHCLYPITFLLSSCNFYFLNNWEKIALFSRGTLHIILKKFVRYNFK